MLENVKLNTARGPQEEPIHHTTKLELQVHVWGLPKAEGERISKRIAENNSNKKHERVSNNHEKRYLGKSRLSSTSWAVQKKVLFLHELRSHHNIPWSKTTSTHKKAKKRVAVQDLVGHHLKEPVIMRDFGQPTWNSGLVDEILSAFLGGWFRSNIE